MDELIDWLIEKNKSGYHMVNSVPRLQEMKAFMRMSSGLDLRRIGWNGDGSGGAADADRLASMPGIVRAEDGELRFTDWNVRGHLPLEQHRRP